MLPFNECKKLLLEDNENLTDEQIKQIINLIQELANMSVECFLKNQKDEELGNNVQSKQ